MNKQLKHSVLRTLIWLQPVHTVLLTEVVGVLDQVAKLRLSAFRIPALMETEIQKTQVRAIAANITYGVLVRRPAPRIHFLLILKFTV